VKRIATISAILLIVPCIIAANGDVARPRMKMTPQDTISPDALGAAVIKTIKISDNRAGNKRFPGVCENAQGDRLVIYRGPNILYWYSFARKDASWSAPAVIPNQPALKSYNCTDVEADSTGRFHCLWEDPGTAVVYASFLNGKWATPVKMSLPGKHDMGMSIAVRSNDEVIVADADFVRSPSNSKDIFLFFKGKNDSLFKSKNITNDRESSTMPAVAVDPNDHVWVALKSDLDLHDTALITNLYHFDRNNSLIDSETLSVKSGWNFWPHIAANSEGKVMVSWVRSQNADHFTSLYNPETRKWGSIVKVGIGAPMKPWCTFWSKLAAHGKDFYLAAMNSGRYLRLMKFNEKTQRWANVATISDDPVYYFDLYSGNDQMLIAWDNANDPSNVYLTTVDVPALGPSTSRISGTVRKDSSGLSGVTMTGLPGNPATDTSGEYSADVEHGWGGTVRPQKSGYSFSPLSITYSNITSDQTGQDYAAIEQFVLTIQSTLGGTTTPPPGSYSHDPNSRVTVTANPDPNYQFANWTGDASGSGNPITLTIDRDKTIKANFIQIRSVANLKVEKRVERGFFNGYTLNVLTWEANPENTELGLVISAQRVYRKARTEGNSKWARIAELAGSILRYEDRNVPSDSDYVYAVTCVDNKGNESAIY